MNFWVQYEDRRELVILSDSISSKDGAVYPEFVSLDIRSVRAAELAEARMRIDNWKRMLPALVSAKDLASPSLLSAIERFLVSPQPLLTIEREFSTGDTAPDGGQFVTLMFCEVISVLFVTALGGMLGEDPVSQLSVFLPMWFIVPLLFAIILGSIAANVPKDYTAGLGLLAMRIPINRVTLLAIIALFTLSFRVFTVFYGEFFFLNYTMTG